MTIRAREWGDHDAMLFDRERARRRAEAAEVARREEVRAIMSKAPADPREALRKAVAGGKDSLAALSRMLGRSNGYLRRFIVDGVPVALPPDHHRRLADYFGLTQRELGIRDLWCDRH
jgi:hypothetical protein